MSRRWMRAFALAMLVHGLGSCDREVEAQESGGCEPLDREALADVMERLSLDGEQRAWLLEALAAGRLHNPEDIAGVPGLAAERAEALAAAFCWGPSWSGDLVVRSRWRETGPRNEMEGRFESGAVRLLGRVRRDPGLRRARGAVTGNAGGWSLLAGTLRSRQGLGLAVATPGAELRGAVPLTGSAGPAWRASLAAAEPPTQGVALQGRILDTGVSLAWIDPASGTRSTLGLDRDLGGVRAGLSLVATEAIAFRLQPGGTPGDWNLEWVRTRTGSAGAGSWARRLGSWRLRAGWFRTGADYTIPGHPDFGRRAPDEALGVRGEVRWQPVAGRHLRAEFQEAREPGASGTVTTRTSEVELRERIERGWTVRALGRRRSRESLGAGPVRDLDLLRLVLEMSRSPWRGRAQWETRWEPEGTTRSLWIRIGRGRDSAWEVRVARVEPDPDSGGTLYWYRRRAGGQYGWDRLPEGTWVGIWGRWAGRRGQIELSFDRRAGGWEGTASVRWGVC